jgi:hypothetical protein
MRNFAEDNITQTVLEHVRDAPGADFRNQHRVRKRCLSALALRG